MTRTLAVPATRPKTVIGVFSSRLLRSPTGTVGLFIVATVLIVAALGPSLAPLNPLEQNLTGRLKPPLWVNAAGQVHYLGTDQLGRDVLSRIIAGSRVSILVAAGAVPISAVLGTLLGVLSGYIGGRVDELLMRLVDIQLALPFMLLILAVVAVLGPGLLNMILVLGMTGWAHYTKLVRGDVLSIRHREFILAARALGAGGGRIMARHVLPNVLSPVIVLITLSVPRVIVAEASLSFLGLGIQPPTPSWGGMLSQGREFIWNSWWLSTFSGLAISLTVLGVNLLGDWLRDELDPRLRQSGQ